MYMQFGTEFLAELQQNNLPSSVLGDINIRLQRIEPKVFSFNGLMSSSSDQVDSTKVNRAESNPRKKDSFKEIPVSGGEIDFTDKLVVPVTLNSEKELIREMEKIACMLAAENDWSVRIAAMQRVEALVIGGSVGYPCFHALLKQLVVPLCTQLSDRRSSIVKQACHLLCFLSKELLGDFEACSEMFIPVLFKLVVITVLIIAESADTCIKTMLRNCKVSRILPQIVNHAKHDRNAVLRARCCEYSLLMLEYWVDAPEIQRSADLYEDLIKCCIADAMSEVRSNARRCYRLFKKIWPERSQQLFMSFDSVIQRMINDEDGTTQRRHPSPSVRVRDVRKSHKALQAPSSTNLPGPVTSTVTTVDRNRPVPVGFPLSAGPFHPEVKSHRNGSERSFENMQHANKQRVPAIGNTLAGLNISEKHSYQKQQSDSLDLGVVLPSASGLHFPPIVTASAVTANAIFTDSTASTVKGKQASEKLGGGFMEEHSDDRLAWKSVDKHIDKQYVESSSKDANFRDSQGNVIPNFQRPLLRKNASSRVSGNSRSFLDDNQIFFGETSNYVNGPASLQGVLTEGLSPNSNWFARVEAFNYVRSLLQQDQKGFQEVAQNFEKVMKLFFQHLNDPHHKVAQAALSALADVISACRKPFESYLDRILYHVFSRRTEITEGKTAVIEYAIGSIKKNAMNSDGAANSGILKLWIAKLLPLIYDKNTKLKEAAISCIVSIHTHYDSTGVINYIMCMSAEEQTSLRRILKQQTPRIEMDLINFSQNKRERPRPRNSYDPSDVLPPDGEYNGALKKAYYFGRYSSGLNDIDNGKKLSAQEPVQVLESIAQKVSSEAEKKLNQNLEGDSNNAFICTATGADENVKSPLGHPDGIDCENVLNNYRPSLCFDLNMNTSSNHLEVRGSNFGNDTFIDGNYSLEDSSNTKIFSSLRSRIIIPQILHQISINKESATIRQEALKQLMEASKDSNHSIWTKHFNQILKVVIEVLDDPDSSTRELTFQLVADMVNKQKDAMEDSIELVIEKLLHIAKDAISKVSTEAEKCLSTILSEYDPFKCLSV
ncbi:CLIP-associated protein, putative isoform 4 [Hibiscus syriacus]|uniref:CLIP-associated protein, putative isoform 4 n=1 Tax=Hibiscus syriacus TaxID=106335 RepID=A0A6A3A3S7_HIBSY|nr:CLIP-associated protein, putative isoform 4 [Hibiscus syriacus]